MKLRSLLVLLLTVAPACLVDTSDDFLDEDDEMVGETSQASLSTNGMSLNGMSLNGMSLNGMSLNGMSLNGMSLNGMSLNGMSLNGMSLNGTLLGGTRSGLPISGAGLVGTQLNGTLSNGSTLLLRVDSAVTLPAPNTDVWAYGVSYALAGGSWSTLCGLSGGVPILALPLAGTWSNASGVAGGGAWTTSATAFTFGCRGTALAKCVELGYKPWKTVGSTLLRNHHQACTRMLRADYCGNGKSWTVNGTLINVYDSKGIQADATSWHTDAEWVSSGAKCVDSARVLQPGEPSCFVQLRNNHSCGSFDHGALLIDEYNG